MSHATARYYIWYKIANRLGTVKANNALSHLTKPKIKIAVRNGHSMLVVDNVKAFQAKHLARALRAIEGV